MKLNSIILIFCFVFALYFVSMATKDGDFLYYISGCSQTPNDHPLTFWFLQITNSVIGNSRISVNFLLVFSFGFTYFLVYKLTEKLSNNLNAAFVACIFCMCFTFTYSGTPLKTIMGLALFFFSALALLWFDEKKTKANFILLCLGVLSVFLTHIIATYFIVILFTVYLIRKRKPRFFIFPLFSSLVLVATFWVPYFESNLKVFSLLKHLSIQSVTDNFFLVLEVHMFSGLYAIFLLLIVGFVFSKIKKRCLNQDFMIYSLFLYALFLLNCGVSYDFTYRFYMVAPFVLAPLFGVILKSVFPYAFSLKQPKR